MGPLLLYFVIASLVSVPFLGLLLIRTRRELHIMRAELVERGIIGPVGASLSAGGASVACERLADDTGPPRPLA